MSAPGDGTFAVLLRRLREQRSLTQEELAERAGITAKAVGALERGERTRPYPHTLRSLADALDLGEDDRARLLASVPPRGRAAVSATAASETQPVATSVSPLVGRDEEVARVRELLASGRRLVTITGPGGVGKTRVAQEVLAAEAAHLPGATAYVDLAPLRDPAGVLAQLAAALGIPESARPTVAGLVPALTGRRLLVVLDNLEHLLAAAPDLADLVAHCPDLALLVTSRAALRVRVEHEVALAPLPVPASDGLADVLASPAARLFLDRVAAAGVALEPDEDTAPVVAAICRRLDGIPLAVELAAAGARLLTPAALLARLDERELPLGPRDLVERQRTMTAAIDWSLDLLEPEEVELFTRLAVFVGGFTLEAAEAVADDDVLPVLAALVEHSLVVRAETPDDQPRFRMLEPVRQAAVRRLAAASYADELADRHARWFHDVAVQAGRALLGPSLRELLDRLDADHANLRAAHHRLLAQDRVADALELAGSLWVHLTVRGHAREGLAWLEPLEGGAPHDAARCRALAGRMGLALATGDLELMEGDARRAVVLAERLDDPDLVTEVWVLSVHAAVGVADLESARERVGRAFETAGDTRWGWGLAHAHLVAATVALTSGDVALAGAEVTESVAHARRLDNALALTFALNLAGTLAALRGDDAACLEALGESVDIGLRNGVGWTLSYALPGLAGVAVRLGRDDAAARLFGASASLAAVQSLDVHWPVTRQRADDDLGVVRRRLGDLAFREGWDAGRAATPDEVAALARELTRLARA